MSEVSNSVTKYVYVALLTLLTGIAGLLYADERGTQEDVSVLETGQTVLYDRYDRIKSDLRNIRTQLDRIEEKLNDAK